MAPVRKGARVLREIAWRLREIGNDGRICDLIDSQVTVIEKSTDEFSTEGRAWRCARPLPRSRAGWWNSATTTPRWRRRPSGGSLPGRAGNGPGRGDRRSDFGGKLPGHRQLPRRRRAMIMQRPLPRTARSRARRTCANGNAAACPGRSRRASGRPETAFQNADAQDADEATAGTTDTNAQDADAQDEAVLDMIAMEMGAPDPIRRRRDRRSDRRASPPAEPACRDRRQERPNRSPAAAAGSAGGSSLHPAAPAHLLPRTGGGNVAWLEPHRERHAEKAGHRGQRSAGADPAHEPGREDRVLLVTAFCITARSSPAPITHPQHCLHLRRVRFPVASPLRRRQADAIVFARGDGREIQNHRQSDGEQGRLRQALAADSGPNSKSISARSMTTTSR